MPSYPDFIRDVLITVHMNLHELEERRTFADPEELTYIEAKLAAYREMPEYSASKCSGVWYSKRRFGVVTLLNPP